MASDVCCNEIIGGEILIRVTRGLGGAESPTAEYEALGNVRIQPKKIARTAGASSAGSLWVVEESRPVRVLMSFVNRCRADPSFLWDARCGLTITVVEKSRGVAHILTNAVVVGDPYEVNLNTGEVTGVELVADRYDKHDFTDGSPAQDPNTALALA